MDVSNSRFITTLARVETVEQAKDFIAEIRAEMPDATHHVYAYKIGYGAGVTEGMSDDGEPSGTSGPPALAVVRGAEVGDVALVITRYFGGTKLGTGGLVSAYGAAAKQAIAAMTTEEKIERIEAELRVPYAHFESVKRLGEQYEIRWLGEQFGEEVTLKLAIPVEAVDVFNAALNDLSSGTLALTL